MQIKSRHQHPDPAETDSAARELDVLTDEDWSPRLPINCYLVEHPEGLIMVDTGESSHANDPGYQPCYSYFCQNCEKRWVQEHEEVGAQLRHLGFSPDDVRWVVMTHMHGDHAGGIPNFPHSEILLSGTEAHDALAKGGPLFGYLNMHYPDWFEPAVVDHDATPFESFDQSSALTRDGAVQIVPTPGHTPGHQSVIVTMDDHRVLIAGDASYSESSMLRGELDGVARDAHAHRESTRRMRELCRRGDTITVFAHDPDASRRLEDLVFTVPDDGS
ncbi:N-acyl homoserine lactonase family protein [Williamsia sp. SKLECPSW1]